MFLNYKILLFQSQQDLTMEELDDLANEPKEETKRQKVLRKSRSPERIDPTANVGDTNEVEQIFQKFGITFHNKDDESNDEAENSDKNASHENLENTSSILVPDDFPSQQFMFEEDDHHAQSSSSVSFSREGSVSHSDFGFDEYHGREMLDRTQSSSGRSSSTVSTTSSKSKKKGSGKFKDKMKIGKSRPESEQSLLSDLSIRVSKNKQDTEDIGQV